MRRHDVVTCDVKNASKGFWGGTGEGLGVGTGDTPLGFWGGTGDWGRDRGHIFRVFGVGQGTGDRVGFRVGTGDTLGTGWGLGSSFFISSVK